MKIENLMKIDRFISYYKLKSLSKNYTKIETQKLVPDPSCVWIEVSISSIGKWNFEASYLY